MENNDPSPHSNRQLSRLYKKAARQLQCTVLLCVTLSLAGFSALAQAEVRFVTDCNPEQTFFLAHYYGSKILSVDTSYSKHNSIVFSKSTNYPEGCYLLTDNHKEPLFSFILGHDQSVTLYGSLRTKHIDSIDGGMETSLFRTYEIKRQRILQQLHPYVTDDPAIYAYLEQSQQAFESYRDSIVRKYSSCFLATLVKALQELKIPDPIATNEAQAYQYYKVHYWDGFDLSDNRLLNTPLLESRLDTYLDKVIAQNPDSICTAIDRLIAQIPSDTIRRFMLWHLVAKYQHPVFMGQDQVFVYLYDRYFSILNSNQLSETNRSWMRQKAERLRRLAIGKTAPNLQLSDFNDNPVSIQNIDSDYLILFFHDHDCSLCNSELQQLNAIVTNTKYQATVLCIDMNAEGQAQQPDTSPDTHIIYASGIGYHGDYPQQTYDVASTPLIYLLDRDKHIIAKQIRAEQISEIISSYDHDRKQND